MQSQNEPGPTQPTLTKFTATGQATTRRKAGQLDDSAEQPNNPSDDPHPYTEPSEGGGRKLVTCPGCGESIEGRFIDHITADEHAECRVALGGKP